MELSNHFRPDGLSQSCQRTHFVKICSASTWGPAKIPAIENAISQAAFSMEPIDRPRECIRPVLRLSTTAAEAFCPRAFLVSTNVKRSCEIRVRCERICVFCGRGTVRWWGLRSSNLGAKIVRHSPGSDMVASLEVGEGRAPRSLSCANAARWCCHISGKILVAAQGHSSGGAGIITNEEESQICSSVKLWLSLG